jgi:hypothetical protein
MVSMATRLNRGSKEAVDTASQPEQATLPDLESITSLRSHLRTTTDSTHDVAAALKLGDSPTNQDVINALFKRYGGNYQAMYTGAERDFGIQVEELVRAKDQPFAPEKVELSARVVPRSLEPQPVVDQSPLDRFLRERNLDRSATNQDLINALYARYGSSDSTTYARARRELGVNIELLTKNRDETIDSTLRQSADRQAKQEKHASTTEERPNDRVSKRERTQSHVDQPAEPDSTPREHTRPPHAEVDIRKILDHYPRAPLDSDHASPGYSGPFLRDQFKLDTWIDNSCAIRLHYALHKSGVTLDTDGLTTHPVRPVDRSGVPEAPFSAAIRAKELFSTIEKSLPNTRKTSMEFSPGAKPNLEGVNGLVLYEYADPDTGRQGRHIGIIQNGQEQTVFDPISHGARGTAVILMTDPDQPALALR